MTYSKAPDPPRSRGNPSVRCPHIVDPVSEPPVEFLLVVYYLSINRKLNKRLKLECRCDERLKAKIEGSTRFLWEKKKVKTGEGFKKKNLMGEKPDG